MDKNWSQKRLPFLSLLLATLLALAIAAVACGGDDDDGTASPTDGPTGSASVTPAGTGNGTPQGTEGAPPECTGEQAQRGTITTLAFDREPGRYDPGEDIEITLTIANCGDNNIELSFSTSQRYVMFAEDEAGNEVWNSAAGQSFNQVEGKEIIGPHKTVVYTETWDQKDSNGEQVPEGQYKISAFSIGCAAGTVGNPDCRFGPVRFVGIGDVPTAPPTTTGG